MLVDRGSPSSGPDLPRHPPGEAGRTGKLRGRLGSLTVHLTPSEPHRPTPSVIGVIDGSVDVHAVEVMGVRARRSPRPVTAIRWRTSPHDPDRHHVRWTEPPHEAPRRESYL